MPFMFRKNHGSCKMTKPEPKSKLPSIADELNDETQENESQTTELVPEGDTKEVKGKKPGAKKAKAE